jgi:cytochrome c2
MKLAMVLALAWCCGAGGALAQDAAAAGDAAAGEQVFRRCASCHAVGEGAANKVGPHLNNVVGRTAGTLEGYSYSQAMKDAGAGGMVWTPETLDPFIENPRGHVPGTKMSFPGLKDATERANVIAYLGTFSPDYVPATGGAAAAPAK